MAEGIGAFDLDDYRALLRLAEGDVAFAAKIAKATLAIVEARRDAEVRASIAEVEAEALRSTLDSIRVLLDPNRGADAETTLKQVAGLL